ncbi:MAG: hypothetical protein ACK47B_04450 [Armatimonadota bacterium]
MPHFIAGIYRDRGLADRVVTSLLDAGVPSGDISIVFREEAEEDVTERDELLQEGNPFADLAVHSGWERLGWQGGARPPYRDKIAPKIDFALIAAGPVAIAIGGAQLGACSGGVVGAMDNFGFPLDLARSWRERVVGGGAWVMARVQADDAGRVKGLMEKHGWEMPAESIRHW